MIIGEDENGERARAKAEVIADMLPERLRAFVKLQHAVDIIEIFDSESDGAMSLPECVVVHS